jgi:hypothetical protein
MEPFCSENDEWMCMAIHRIGVRAIGRDGAGW